MASQNHIPHSLLHSDIINPLHSLTFPLGGKLVKCTKFGVVAIPVLLFVAFCFIVWGSLVYSFEFTFGVCENLDDRFVYMYACGGVFSCVAPIPIRLKECKREGGNISPFSNLSFSPIHPFSLIF